MTEEIRIQHVERIRSIARALDSAVRIPGTDIRFGLDSIIGLIPGLGDVSGTVLSGYIVLASARLGVPAPVVTRMILNVLVDTAIGAVPVIGDIFDVTWRANVRNADLLEKHVALPATTTRSSRAIIVGAVVALVLLAAGAVTVSVLLFRALARLAS